MAANRVMLRSLQQLVTCSQDQVQTVIFREGAPRGTVSSAEPFQAPGVFSFEVFMKHKPVKTAVGFLSEDKTTEYMRDTPIGEDHVSFGGAGWIHPKEIAAAHKYTQGDRVKAEVDFNSKVIRFYVNGALAGEDAWQHTRAHPALSVDGGPCDLEVTFG